MISRGFLVQSRNAVLEKLAVATLWRLVAA